MNFKIFRFFLIVILLFLLSLSINAIFRSGFKNITISIFSPIEQFFWREGGAFSRMINGFFEIKKIRIENEQLKQENFILLSENIKLKLFEQENLYLKEALKMSLDDKLRISGVNVLSKSSGEEAIILDKGEKDNVVKGMVLITKEKVLVGKVDEVYSDYSKAILITKEDFKFSVELSGKENENLEKGENSAVARGNGSKLILEFVPKEDKIKAGDIVSTSLLGGVFPEGLLVGEVEEITGNEAEPFFKGIVRPYFLETSLKILFLLEQ